jgi:hypothetical protein
VVALAIVLVAAGVSPARGTQARKRPACAWTFIVKKRSCRRSSIATIPVDRSGRVSMRTALGLFADTVAPLPGVKAVPAPSSLRSGTGPIRWTLGYYARLSPADRRAVDRALSFGVGRSPGSGLAADAEQTKWEALIHEAIDRISKHLGLSLAPTIEVELSNVQPKDKGVGAETTATAATAEPTGSLTCHFTIRPTGRKDSLGYQREIAAHESFHCVQVAIMGVAKYDVAPPWLIEGSANWVGSTIGDEWNGYQIPDHWWDEWIGLADLSLFKRSYSAMGFYAHLDESGLSPWSVLPELLTSPDPKEAARALVDKAGARFLDSWGSGVFRDHALGFPWDTTGPDITNAYYYGAVHWVVGNGSRVPVSVNDEEGAFFSVVDLRADVIQIEPVGGDRAWGRLRSATGAEEDLTLQAYCARADGCVCPPGSAGSADKLPRIASGDARVAVAHHRESKGVYVVGRSLDDYCKAPLRVSDVVVGGAISLHFTAAAACGTFSPTVVLTTHDSAGTLWFLSLSITSGPPDGTFRFPHDLGVAGADLGDGFGHGWDALDDGKAGGPDAYGTFTIAPGGGTATGLVMFDGPGGSRVVADGSWRCGK